MKSIGHKYGSYIRYLAAGDERWFADPKEFMFGNYILRLFNTKEEAELECQKIAKTGADVSDLHIIDVNSRHQSLSLYHSNNDTIKQLKRLVRKINTNAPIPANGGVMNELILLVKQLASYE